MNHDWRINFEWVVTGAAVIGVIMLLVLAEVPGRSESTDQSLPATDGVRCGTE